MPEKRRAIFKMDSLLRWRQKQKTKRDNDLSEAEENIVDNIVNFIQKHESELNEQYSRVKTNGGLNNTLDIYETIEEATYYKELMRVSVVVLTANYFESEFFNLNAAEKSGQKIKELKNGLLLFNESRIVKAYIAKIDDYYVLHLHAPETGSNTPCGSADLARYVTSCEFLNPSCIVSFGICFGIEPGIISIGDTLIAEKLYPWSVALKINNDNWIVKNDNYVINLREKSPILYSRIEEKANQYQGPNNYKFAVMGNMITSEAVISSEKMKQTAIDRAYGCNIIGGEMEGYGVAKECINYSNTPCVILKAVCDWGAVKNIDKYLQSKLKNYKDTINYKDCIQAYAAHCAYQFLEELFEEQLFDKRDLIGKIFLSLSENYQADYVISKDVLESFIKQSLNDFLDKFSELSEKRKIKMIEMVIEQIVSQYLIEDEKGEMYTFQC